MVVPLRQLLTVQKILLLILLLVDDHSWCFLSETSKLASNTAWFSFVVTVSGIKTIEEEDTLHFTLAALAEMIVDEKSRRNFSYKL